MIRRQGWLAAAAVAVAMATPAPAHAGLFDGGGGSFLDDIMDMIDDIDFSFGDLGFGSAGEIDPLLVTTREAASTAAAEVMGIPSLLSAQILQYAEAYRQSEYQWRMVEAMTENEIEASIATAAAIRDDLGEQGVLWEPGGALGQHDAAYVESPGADVINQQALLGHLTEMVALKTAAGEELAKIIATQVEAQEEDTATLRAMLDNTMAAMGTTQAVQGLAQLQGLLIEKFGEQQATNAAFQKMLLAQSSADEAERMIALLQQNLDARDMLFADSFGVPGNSLGGGGVAVASRNGGGPFTGFGF